jgi:RHS repeat-associated protein
MTPQLHTVAIDLAQKVLHLVGAAPPDDHGPAVQYHLADHLGSSNVVTGGDDASASAFVNREEHTSYGDTSFGWKRYRFSGKERDEESRLYYYGLRYYAPWLGCWASCDPLCLLAGISARAGTDQNPFSAFAANPLHFVDPRGLQPQLSTVDFKDEFRSRLNVLMQQGWVIDTDEQGRPKEFTAPELAGKSITVGESRWQYKKSITLVHPHQIDPIDRQPTFLPYHIFEEVEPRLIDKTLRVITPVLEWASCIPGVGDFVDLAMPAVYAAQGRYEEAALAGAALAMPGLSIGIIKKTGLGDQALKVLGKSADEGATMGLVGTKRLTSRTS